MPCFKNKYYWLHRRPWLTLLYPSTVGISLTHNFHLFRDHRLWPTSDLIRSRQKNMVEITIRKRPRAEAVITQRKFFKKTARGKVIKGQYSSNSCNWPCLTDFVRSLTVLRERYLRDDVGCGIHSCGICASTMADPTLPSSGSLEHALFPDGHFLLPDTNVFLAQVRFPCRMHVSSTGAMQHMFLQHADSSLMELHSTNNDASDGLDRIKFVQAPYHIASDRFGRSPASFATAIQSSQGSRQSRWQTNLGFLQRVPLVSISLISHVWFDLRFPAYSARLP